MSTAQINATHLLCRLLEQTKPEVNGAALLGGDLGDGGQALLRERLLVIGASLSYVTCPECGVEMARVVREVGGGKILLYCDECGDIKAGRALGQTYKVSLSRVVDQLIHGLGMLPSSVKEIQSETIWRLGVHAPKRGRAVTWYFARHLKNHAIAKRLADQIRQDKASLSAKVLTSSELPLPDGSPLVDFDVTNLSAIGRISQSKFEFFAERISTPASTSAHDTSVGTTLRYVAKEGIARVDGVDYKLAPRQKAILLALLTDYDHSMDLDSLRTACRSQADTFSPSKAFELNPEVYKAFITYQPYEEVYVLQLPHEDRDWLT